jgi:hypothetical protein
MPINKTYLTWIQRICELRPQQRITQVKNFVWLVVGIYHSRSVSLSRIAGKVLSTAKNVSTVRRLSRFLANPAIDVRYWYKPIAKAWLQNQYERVGEIRLIVDGTKVGFAHQLLMVSLAYRHRAVPIAWTWVKYIRGHSWQTADPTAQVRQEPIAEKSTCFYGRRQRIWLHFGARTAQTVVLVLCVASKRQYDCVDR